MEKYGLIFSLCTAVLWGVAPIFEKLGLVRISPLAAITIRNISITVILLVVVAIADGYREIVRADFKTLVFVIAGGIIAGILGMWSYFKAMKYWEASRVVPIVGAYPLFAFIFSIILLGEKITLQKTLGAALVVFGVFLLG